jgi:hypothetical protein
MSAMAAVWRTARVCNARGTGTATVAASVTLVGASSIAPSAPRAGPAETTCASDCQGFAPPSPARPPAVIASAAPSATAAAAPSSVAVAQRTRCVLVPAIASPRLVTPVACPPISNHQGFPPLPRFCPYAMSARFPYPQPKPPPHRRCARSGIHANGRAISSSSKYPHLANSNHDFEIAGSANVHRGPASYLPADLEPAFALLLEQFAENRLTPDERIRLLKGKRIAPAGACVLIGGGRRRSERSEDASRRSSPSWTGAKNLSTSTRAPAPGR